MRLQDRCAYIVQVTESCEPRRRISGVRWRSSKREDEAGPTSPPTWPSRLAVTEDDQPGDASRTSTVGGHAHAAVRPGGDAARRRKFQLRLGLFGHRGFVAGLVRSGLFLVCSPGPHRGRLQFFQAGITAPAGVSAGVFHVNRGCVIRCHSVMTTSASRAVSAPSRTGVAVAIARAHRRAPRPTSGRSPAEIGARQGSTFLVRRSAPAPADPHHAHVNTDLGTTPGQMPCAAGSGDAHRTAQRRRHAQAGRVVFAAPITNWLAGACARAPACACSSVGWQNGWRPA